ncbi:AAA family ATPase [Spirulina sp. CS-785/01]|uniref:AAA family ATPase n=1 Tax=Spirulina sp. CS-785/01 TaxID=3021716 RepID=UPI00232A9D29|nr:ATP-binding protein [Spirulina sp. CS-785/01]MDB9314096.1 AAA family ATPase [Spirulina sp. CS-785/01]
MLQSFEIKNFRLFQHLQVEKLSHVNLLVGGNNAGKTTFLEAIELYASNGSSTVLLELLEARQETWFSAAQLPPQSHLAHPLRHLFWGHKLPQIGETGIILGDISSLSPLHLHTAAYQRITEDSGIIKRLRLSAHQLHESMADFEIFLIKEEGQNTQILLQLDDLLSERYHVAFNSTSRFFYQPQKSGFKYLWQMVSTDNLPNRKLAALWDLTSLTPLESEIIAALNLIDERVSGVAFVEDMSQKIGSSESRIPLVKIEGIGEPLPLKSMGDGMTRLFHIIVALVNAKNGILLIDEFENGLHWTVQPKVWNIIFKLAKKLNVQVFATTHSRDCVKAFDTIWNQYPDLGAFFRLDAKDKTIKATEYASETLTDALEMDVEVR